MTPRWVVIRSQASCVSSIAIIFDKLICETDFEFEWLGERALESELANWFQSEPGRCSSTTGKAWPTANLRCYISSHWEIFLPVRCNNSVLTRLCNQRLKSRVRTKTWILQVPCLLPSLRDEFVSRNLKLCCWARLSQESLGPKMTSQYRISVVYNE